MPEQCLVLFVCLHASAKSLIAAEYFNKLAGERRLPFRAVSAGTEPDGAVPPHVVAGLRDDGYDVSRRVPERLTRELAAPRALRSRSSRSSPNTWHRAAWSSAGAFRP